jgi:hypothetical protein
VLPWLRPTESQRERPASQGVKQGNNGSSSPHRCRIGPHNLL